ncbi:MAG: neutral/alkaline non-lysosomal ceramidase N-terminal domain-containing protein [Pirellulaceae bacterium]|nr:neutral/alkaline non-lysosomal ceramidase N-terminal domain-containing protein [Pirellulaceae bacterium]
MLVRIIIILAAMITATWSSSMLVAADADWFMGIGRKNITPQKSMWMAGYGGRDQPADGTLTELWAKALVLEDATGHRGVLLALDLVGIDRQLSVELCSMLSEEFQLQRNQIAICTSHTHTGPVVGQNLSPLHYRVISAAQQALVDEYTEWLKQKSVEAVRQALEMRLPCSLSWGNGSATFAVNRRNNPEGQVPLRRAAGQLVGPFDHDVPVLAVKDANGKLSAIVFGYACHATVLSSYQWSGDYPGFAQLELESRHPECMALFFAGCGADQNPLPRRSVELARHYGRRLADAVDSVLLTSQMSAVTSTLKTNYREIELSLDQLPDREQIERDARADNKFVAARARLLLEQMADGAALPVTYPYPIGSWQLGNDVQFVTLGGEVVVDYALRLKSELAAAKTWVAAYAHDVMAYIPSRRVLREGGYEGSGAMIYYGLPTVWAPAVENAIVEEVHRQLKPSLE